MRKEHKQRLKYRVNEMLDQGIIQPPKSPWASPTWVDSGYCFRKDYCG